MPQETFEIYDGERDYTYRALVMDGKLVEITAGCQEWLSFKEARAHYHGMSLLKRYPINFGTYKWQKDMAQTYWEDLGYEFPAGMLMHRKRILGILRELEKKVKEYQAKWRAAHRKKKAK